MGALRIGVAGWDYPDWKGVVYPAAPRRGFDALTYLARYVDVVEINASFYRPVAARTAASWARRTADLPGFTFTAKAHRSVTHESPQNLIEAATRSMAGLLPLRDSGKLRAVLLQFPQSFRYETSSLDRLRAIVGALHGWPLVLEVRHASWENDSAEAFARDAGIGWCVVDQPSIGRSTIGPTPRATGAIGYLRLHGRNTRDWFRADAGRDARYDYLYSREELAPMAEIARELAVRAEEVFVIQNNHFRGKAVVNALQLKHAISRERPEAPASLVAAYPEIEPDVTARDPEGRLF